MFTFKRVFEASIDDNMRIVPSQASEGAELTVIFQLPARPNGLVLLDFEDIGKWKKGRYSG